MSTRKFKGKNTIRSSRELFNERAKYHNDAVPQQLLEKYPGVFRNFWFIENMYYGKIDRQHHFLIAKPEKVKILDNSSSKSIFLLDFVADAMSAFLSEHSKALAGSKIRKNDAILSALLPEKGYTNILYDYDLHMNSVGTRVNASLRSKESHIEDFGDFMTVFLEHYLASGEITPLTLTGFIGSRLSPLSSTGLFTDFSSLGYDRDGDKVEMLIDKPNYKFFIKNCSKHGFLIDYNVPWRVCANLGSLEMEKHMFKYGSTSNTVFDDYYDLSYHKDIDYLLDYLLKYYNRFISLKPYIKKEKIQKEKKLQTFRYTEKRKSISKEQVKKRYDDEFRVGLYVDIRNYESKDRYSLALREKIKENAIAHLKVNDSAAAYEYIDSQYVGFLNDPYGFNGVKLKREFRDKHQDTSGQETQELLDKSVFQSRKTLY